MCVVMQQGLKSNNSKSTTKYKLIISWLRQHSDTGAVPQECEKHSTSYTVLNHTTILLSAGLLLYMPHVLHELNILDSFPEDL
jgi:hypothetical protein